MLLQEHAIRLRHPMDGEGRVVDELLECARRCLACAGASWLGVSLYLEREESIPEDLLVIIDCAEFCEATARTLIRRSPERREICALTARICERAAAAARKEAQLEAIVLPALRCARSCRSIAQEVTR
jgi:hypothetical protein